MEKYTGFSGRASLATVGMWLKKHRIWNVIEERVKIKQKVVKHRPTDKVKDLLINILAGGHGIVEVNHRVRADRAVQLAFGRHACAEQSTISETLDASTSANVAELAAALTMIYQQHGRGYRHAYDQQYQVLDIDLSAQLAGAQAEGATKGYFSGHENRRGRQVGRVTASRYDEIVCEQLSPGRVQLDTRLPDLVQRAETVLALDDQRRPRTVLRFDAGGGTTTNINFCLTRDYYLLTKTKNWQRTRKLCQTVTVWHPLPHLPDHECGWVTQPHAYARPTRQLALRWPNPKKGGWHYSVIVFNLPEPVLFDLARTPQPDTYTDVELMTVIVNAYDARGGGVETSYKNSKQGLGLNKRNKKRFHAQEMLLLVAQLAYNLTRWVQQELAHHAACMASFGPLRMTRDAFQISGHLEFDAQGQLCAITLNHLHQLAQAFHDYWQAHFTHNDLRCLLGKI